MKVLYFAWLRERIGKAEETLDVPASVQTVADLIAHLKAQGPEYENAFRDEGVVRAAINQRHVAHDTPLGDAGEVALFPPMTGG